MDRISKYKKAIIPIVIVFVAILILSKCGKNNDNSEDTILVTISINYEKVKGSYNDDAKIYVDGKEMGTINVQSSKEFDVYLTEGTHSIKAVSDTKLRKDKSNKVKFIVSEKDSMFSFNMKQGLFSGLKISKNKK